MTKKILNLCILLILILIARQEFVPLITFAEPADKDSVGICKTGIVTWDKRKFSKVMVSTVAGKIMTEGSTDGIGEEARFSFPRGITVDNHGMLYVVDSNNCTIRKISPNGSVTTFAGNPGQRGSTDGTGAAARFHDPSGIARDRHGNLYVVDTMNSTIRKINPFGVVTTFAGAAGQIGSADGIGAAARFHRPNDITIDGDGNLYVTDSSNHTIRKISPTGTVTTIAGTSGKPGSANGIGWSARFNKPQCIAVDRDRNLYVTDSSNHTIRKIAPKGIVTTVAGKAGHMGAVNGTGEEARFKEPQGIAVDNFGILYVADNICIRKITPNKIVTTFAGKMGSLGYADGEGKKARFAIPYGITVDGNGDLYLTEMLNRIRKITFEPIKIL